MTEREQGWVKRVLALNLGEVVLLSFLIAIEVRALCG